ncbi:hypothetical protein C0993_005929 [Termitomyces sp. T159_Od127]|nr:hypothetical protein C0993_005929 [Termitomyces sp. T159_Od127]
MHTLRFSKLQTQYLEAIFELEHGQHLKANTTIQLVIEMHISHDYGSFGDFVDKDRFAGFIPSEHYLADMLNKVIKSQEHDAVQHTSCLLLDRLAIDDSHKINKHMAKCDGIPVFTALFTCMTSRYVQAQILTLTKAHEEQVGPLTKVAQSAERYGYPPPPVIFSDDPVKDKSLLYSVFPSLLKGLTPVATAYGLNALKLPNNIQVTFLSVLDLCEKALSPLIEPLDEDSNAYLCISFNAEWNLSRWIGVSIIQLAPHSNSEVHKFTTLPPTLLHLLISNRIFKIGVSVQGDLTRLKKQFPQLLHQITFYVVDLKEFCISQDMISHKESDSLDKLVEKVLGVYLVKDDSIQRSEEWEANTLSAEHLQYAALDEGGDVVAHGCIAFQQPTVLGRIRVKTPTHSHLVIDANKVLNPSAAAILHINSGEGSTRTKANTFTFGQLQAASSSETGVKDVFQVVMPVNLLDFDKCSDSKSIDELKLQEELFNDDENDSDVALKMLKAHSAMNINTKGENTNMFFE